MADQKRGKVQRKAAAAKKTEKTDKKRPVELVFTAPDANAVYVAGDFNQWDHQSLPMKKKNESEWSAVMQLPAGRYEFKYIVDGRWVEEASGMEMVKNTFGTHNFVLQVS